MVRPKVNYVIQKESLMRANELGMEPQGASVDVSLGQGAARQGL